MYIPALVIQYNNDVFINGGIDPGTIKLIPTPSSGGNVFDDYWAVPVSDNIVSGFEYVPCAPGATSKPTPQAFHVVRINSTQVADNWYVYGTSTQYIQASKDAECCASPGFSMPTDISDIAACQSLCANSDGYGFGVFGLPSPVGGGSNLRATGYYTVTATGVTTTLPGISSPTAAQLATALNGNASWALVGEWSVTSDGLTLSVVQDALLTNTQEPNVVCVLVEIV